MGFYVDVITSKHLLFNAILSNKKMFKSIKIRRAYKKIKHLFINNKFCE